MMNWKRDKWICIKIALLGASSVLASLQDSGDRDPSSYPFVTTLPILFGAILLPLFLRKCEPENRYASHLDVWRAHPFVISTGPIPFWHFTAWSALVVGIFALVPALFGDRDLGTAFFMMSAGIGSMIGLHRTLKRKSKTVEPALAE